MRISNAKPRRLDTRQLVVMAMLTALGVILSFIIDIPLIPAAPFLKYDPSGVPMLLSSLLYGPLAGSIVSVATCLIHGSTDGIIGIIMNILASLATVIPAGLIFARMREKRGGIVVALVVSAVCMIAGNVLFNLIFTPLYLGIPVKEVAKMIVPFLLPFNVFKALLNAVFAAVVYKAVARFLGPDRQATTVSTAHPKGSGPGRAQ